MDSNAHRTGYDPGFLGPAIEPPARAGEGAAVAYDDGEVVPYAHFSLSMHGARRLARWVAWNIDGGGLMRLNRTGIRFTKDRRVPAGHQAGDELYSANRLDRGHIARRADLLWGGREEAEAANRDSFYFTNIAPQLDDFNQSSRQGVWGRIEDALFEDVEVQGLRASVFGGPVFHDDDRVYRGVPIPREFWKLVAFLHDDHLTARAFLLTQNLSVLEALEIDEFRTYQVSVAELEDRTGLRFDAPLHDADTLAVTADDALRRPLDAPADIQW
ncbi:DNA/RNA non-specific endonuclease [Zafaria sp. J156]|uniref:DNA/RNA non-specific endonuclease n=1 Tax=Zafaria sp. J156 TaxID=3116490 RepID=UPI002E783A76|nr:DNA/RNA non-specific endonuclease [Zafaria sp. J156]MEE1620042.1 DNA/RNA non-specific endonuclease [Zafaria sp. J156]